MKVILQKNVPDLGDIGDIKDVADGYARNYLLPRKLVIPASVGSTKAILHQKRLIEKKLAQRKVEMEGLAGKMKEVGQLEIMVRVGANQKLFGSVTAIQISTALREKGYEIDKRKIEMSDRIRTLGEHNVRVKLAENIVVPLAISVIADPDSIVEEEELPSAPAEEATEEQAAESTEGEATEAPAAEAVETETAAAETEAPAAENQEGAATTE